MTARTAQAPTTPAPILLVGHDSVPGSVTTELRRLGVDRVVILGGTGSVSSAVASRLAAILDGSLEDSGRLQVGERFVEGHRLGDALQLEGAELRQGEAILRDAADQ